MDINTVLILILATYGLIKLLIEILSFIIRKKDIQKAKLVLLVKDQEENIEGIVREAIESSFVRGIAINGEFIVLDMDSKDETLAILKLLEKQYPLLKVCSYEDRNILFEKNQ